MKKLAKTLSLILALVMVFSIVSCAKKPSEPVETNPDNDTVTTTSPDDADTATDVVEPDDATVPEEPEVKVVVDHNGNEIELPDEINRIVVCDIYPLPSVLAVFFDSADKLVGIPKQAMVAAKNGLLGELYPEILNAKMDYIDGTTVNVEELLSLEPDIAFYSADDAAMGETLANAGVPAIAVSASKWEYDAVVTLENWIDLLSEIFPENDRSEIVKAYSSDVVSLVNDRVENVETKKNLFFLFQYSDSSITTSGKHFFGEWWANASGAQNVGAELESAKSTPVEMEQVYVWNPEIIFISNYTTAQVDDIMNNTIGNYDWSEIEAVKNGKVYKMPLGMYRSYTCGVDTPVTLLWMAKTVYPELFEDIDITAEAQKYYKAVFDIELTTEQVEKIFAPSSDASAY